MYRDFRASRSGEAQLRLIIICILHSSIYMLQHENGFREQNSKHVKLD